MVPNKLDRRVCLCILVATVALSPPRHALGDPGFAAGAQSAEECGWRTTFPLADLDGPAYAVLVWDDGTGPALYVGGRFSSAGRVAVNNIARWNGSWWSPLPGPNGRGVDGMVRSLTVHDDGTGEALYAGGEFDTAGGVTVNKIARWDGLAWSALMGPGGPGIPSYWILTDVHAMVPWDDGTGEALYVGGTYQGGRPGGIAAWDGASWSGLGAGVSNPLGGGGSVETLAVWDDGTGSALYVGGDFAYPTSGVARWNGTSWAWPAAVSMGYVTALAVWDDGTGSALYAGGSFTSAGGTPVNRIARWDGSSWSPLTGPSGTGTDRGVNALTVWNDGTGDALYVGGYFTIAGGLPANRVSRWDGTSWAPLAGSSGNGIGDSIYDGVYALGTWDDPSAPALIVGGDFATAGGNPAHHVATWDGMAWSPPSAPPGAGLGDTVYALTLWDDGSGIALYAGGSFLDAGGTWTNHVARWDGMSWTPLADGGGTGTDGDVRALAAWNDGTGEGLYAAGCFSVAGGVGANNIARWDGSTWSPLASPSGNGVDGCVDALAVWNDGTGDALYAGGYFTTAGGVVVNRIAKWDGASWSPLTGPLDTGVNRAVHSLAAWDDGNGPALYAGGYFYQAGGVVAYYLARWDGTAWSSLPTSGLDGRVYALEAWDDGTGGALYAGGAFTAGGGQTMNHIGRWDGASWSPLSGPSYSGMDSAVAALEVWDDGTGDSLYAGGWFSLAGGLPANLVGRWDGTAWSALSGPQGNGISGWEFSRVVYALRAWDQGADGHLFAGGAFELAGGVPSANLAEWTFCVAVFADGFETADTGSWTITVP